MKVIIIGSGIAGLTAAAYLVREGHNVVIYEQFSEIGGVTATLHQDGFSWEGSTIKPRVVTFPWASILGAIKTPTKTKPTYVCTPQQLS